MKQVLTFVFVLMLLQSCLAPAPENKVQKSPGWTEVLDNQLPLLGHRNWILVVDKAFPAQTAMGIEVINSGENLLDVLGYTLDQIGQSTHVKPVVYTDHELSFISAGQVPAIEAYREALSSKLAGYQVKTMLHDSVFVKIDQASKLFKVVVIKTEEVIPYSSVFIELDCSYWTPVQEKELRDRMAE